MNVSIKPILRTSKRRKDGTCPVWIRITANRKSRYVSSGVAVEARYWNDAKGKVRKSHPIAPALNDRIERLVTDLKQEALSSDNRTAEAVKKSVTGTGGSFTDYFQQHTDCLHAAGRYYPWKGHRVTLGKLTACFGERIDWQDLDADFLHKYERWLRKKGNGPSTIHKEMQRIQYAIRQALKEGVLTAFTDPFLTYDKPKERSAPRRKLAPDEVAALEALDLPEGSVIALARDSWLFSFYTGGMRFGDLCKLKVGDVKGGRVAYTMNKTGARISNPLPPQALELAERYAAGKADSDFLLPHLKSGEDAESNLMRRRIGSRNALTNKYLKAVAERAGLEPDGFSMHVARHSFADYARTKSPNLYAISKTLGHANLKITETYLRSFDQQAVDALGAELWGE